MAKIEKAKIYGVDGIGGSNPSALVRTDDATGLTTTVNASTITSAFDNLYPWCEMRDQTDEYGNVFVRIPKFYSKMTKNANGTYKLQISGIRHDGFMTLFIDGQGNELDYVLVGKYEASGNSSRIYSKSGETVLVSQTLATFRNAARANGTGYQQYDFLIDAIIKHLFLVEFATTNSQSIMVGYTDGNNAAAVVTGQTNGVMTPSGSEISNTSGTYACKYRNIENPWGNTWTFCDGISFSVEKIYVCTDPTKYESGKITTPYAYVGNRATASGYAKTITPFAKMPLLGYTTDATGSATTYYSDNHYYAEGGQILFVGGGWDSGANAGLWFWRGSYASGYSYSGIGGRLCYKPL